ncbi:MAG TPA: thiol reductant ABC exporter subunit CydD, partial [Nocardioides sp.]|uniref:thiol reductant ABC exporter subunit CydD n=1 Tax=Nocardioides sp. TaxID=35761 RepID=UPI002EDB74A7
MRPTDPVLREAVRPARRPLAVVVALGVVGAALLVVQAWVVTRLVVAAVGGDPVTGWAGLVVAVFALRALAGWGSDVAAARAAVTVGRDVRRRVLAAALAGRARGSSGAITALATRGAAAAEPYLTRYLPALVLGAVLPVLVVAAIAVADPLSALVVVLTLPLVPVFGALVGSATRDQAESQWRAMADLSGHFLDVVRGLPTLVAFRRAEAQSDTIRAVTDRYRERTLATLRIAFASSAILELVATLSVALVAVTVGLRLATGSLPLTTALVVLLLAPEAYWPLRRVGAEFHAAAEGAATFAQAAAWGSSPGFPSVESRVPEGRVAGSRGAIVADGVAVTYPGRDVPALAPTSLVVPAAGVTAIVGPSGCGKSTLLSVLAGLLEPTEGYVDRPARHEIAVLPQRPVFLAGTLADNLRLARPDATDADLWAALRDVALADRVASLPAGLDTPLGEDGLTLSAGERARLGLARVVLADRPWVLLDEPTAHLDGLTEQVIADTVAALGRSRAVVLVAHRPTLVALADRVVELAPPREPGTRPTGTRDSTHGNPRLDPREPATRPTGTRGSTGWGSAVIGGLASLFGVALTATAGWLIVQASHEPPVLTLMVAIVGVRAFGIGRPVLRYVERLRSHDTALRLLAERRVAVYDALVPLTPGRLGRRRGDLLASVVDDVDAVLDRELRVRLPIRSFVVVAVLSTAVTTLLSPVAGAVVAVTCLVGGAGTYALARLGSSRAEERAVQGRALVSERVTEAVQTATELRAWQAEGRALAGVDEAGREVGAGTLTSARWLGLARGAVLLTVGLGVAATALLLEGAVGAGELTGPFLALLLLTPLALAEPLTTVTEAGALTARTRAAEARL